jgi:uncharacterized protein (TIGR02271 family)
MMSEQGPNTIITKDGVRGTLVEGMPSDTATDHVAVAFENGQRVLVPVDALTLQAGGQYYYLALRLDALEQQSSDNLQSTDQPYVVPVAEEVLDIERRQVETGRIRVQKLVHERTELVDEPLLRDEVTITRVPVNRVIDQPVGTRQEGETLIVPVFEEVLVVEKRLLLVEEVHITRRTREIHQPEEVTLRREEVVVERIAPHAQEEPDGADTTT